MQPPQRASDEHRVLRLLSAGRPADAVAVIAEHFEDDEPFAALARADARMHVLDIDIPELQHLVAWLAAVAPEREDLRLWGDALLCERLTIDADPTAVVLAVDAERRAPSEALPPLITAYAAARIRRVIAHAGLLVPDVACWAESEARAADVHAVLLRYGLREEALAGMAAFAVCRAMFTGEEIDRDLEILTHVRAEIGDCPDSLWPAAIELATVSTAVTAGDLALAADRVARIRLGTGHPMIEATTALWRDFMAWLDDGAPPDAFGPGSDVVVRVGELNVQWLRSWQTWTAHLLADRGHPLAGRFARASSTGPQIGGVHAVTRRLLTIRIDLKEQGHADTDGVKEVLESMARVHRRNAASLALRLSRDLESVGATTEASALHTWGLERLPEPHRWTVLERSLAEPPALEPLPSDRPDGRDRDRVRAPNMPQGCRGATLDVQILQPSVIVRHGAETLAMTTTQAKLILALGLSHPRPVHVEQLSDILWPDDDMDKTRPRLSIHLHRLSRAAPGARLVERDGDLVRLGRDVATTDLATYRAALAGPEANRVDALTSVRGNLCAAQFPYDDAFVDARHRFSAEWLSQATDLIDRGHATAMTFSAVFECLGLDPQDGAWDPVERPGKIRQ